MIRLQELKKILPKLTYKSEKGKNGLVGIIGGSFEYTGAPYYAAISAVKMGADLSHIFCSKEAAAPIKSYSPELIVHPVFAYEEGQDKQPSKQEQQQHSEKWMKYISTKLEKFNSWVIGPGLGRNKSLNLFFTKFIKALPEKTPLTIDADGLYFLCQYPELMDKLKKLNCVLTPNKRQFKYLNKILKFDESVIEKYLNQQNQSEADTIKQIQLKDQSPVTVIIKGEKDLIFHKGNKLTVVNILGGKKRCGGIGDVLAGCVAACSYWGYQNGPILACHVTRRAAQKAYQKHLRSLTGLGVLEQVQEVVIKQL